MDDRSVERLLSLRAEHAEGPIWDAPTARLWWVDITAERVANNAPLEQAMPWTARCVQRLHGARGTDPAGQFALLRGPVGWPFRPARPAHQAGQHQRRVHQAGLDAPQGPQGHDEDGALRRRQRARQRAGRFHPGPCCNNPFVRDPEGALIDHHEGINGVGDLDSAVDGWTGRPGSPSSGCPSLRLPRTGRADHSTQLRIICFRANLWLVTGIRCSVEIVGHRTVVDEWSVRG
jgi:hypothetical protein